MGCKDLTSFFIIPEGIAVSIMSKKLKILILTNIVLLATIVVSLTWKNDQSGESNEALILADLSLDAVDKIVINENEILLKNRQWQVNATYNARPSKINTLLGILSSIEVKREVTQEAISTDSPTFKVKTFNQNILSSEFELGSAGSEIWLKTPEQKYYFVYVPGFFFNPDDYFAVDERSWRDRKILNTSWQTLRSLAVNYTGDPENSFKITFDSTFYKVEGVPNLDSAAVYNYIILYEGFEVGAFISDQTIEDSLSQVTPLCTIHVEDINPSRGGVLEIYPGPQAIFGKLKEKGELVALDPRLLRTFLVNKDFFKVQ